ncbi:hypothetical protein K456DRAFT_189453 [Colletotrichum gloeosporioides 23]|nr:hypothetical protein K456DRAFT_189453 [Colletotrichum gloeosporioides 23]
MSMPESIMQAVFVLGCVCTVVTIVRRQKALRHGWNRGLQMGWVGCESGESRSHHFIRQWYIWEMDEFLPVIRSKDGKSRLDSHHPGSAERCSPDIVHPQDNQCV